MNKPYVLFLSALTTCFLQEVCLIAVERRCLSKLVIHLRTVEVGRNTSTNEVGNNTLMPLIRSQPVDKWYNSLHAYTKQLVAAHPTTNFSEAIRSVLQLIRSTRKAILGILQTLKSHLPMNIERSLVC